MSENPLAGHFRVPGVHQELPSRGNYYRQGEIKLAMNGEIAVLPMTAADEIILKNPDGLLNGDSIERLLSSCVPDIKNTRNIPNPDVDVLLLGDQDLGHGLARDRRGNGAKARFLPLLVRLMFVKPTTSLVRWFESRMAMS